MWTRRYACINQNIDRNCDLIIDRVHFFHCSFLISLSGELFNGEYAKTSSICLRTMNDTRFLYSPLHSNICQPIHHFRMGSTWIRQLAKLIPVRIYLSQTPPIYWKLTTISILYLALWQITRRNIHRNVKNYSLIRNQSFWTTKLCKRTWTVSYKWW